ncbi:complex I intermediate-associated protein 30, mitochondrial isoform X2 [Rhinoraja longicauda]
MRHFVSLPGSPPPLLWRTLRFWLQMAGWLRVGAGIRALRAGSWRRCYRRPGAEAAAVVEAGQERRRWDVRAWPGVEAEVGAGPGVGPGAAEVEVEAGQERRRWDVRAWPGVEAEVGAGPGVGPGAAEVEVEAGQERRRWDVRAWPGVEAEALVEVGAGPGVEAGAGPGAAEVEVEAGQERRRWDVRAGAEALRRHWRLLRAEVAARLSGPDHEELRARNRVLWHFQGAHSLQGWAVTSDRDIGGRSSARLRVADNGSAALLSGRLDTEPPRDGLTRYSGYCTLRSPPPQGPFDLKRYYDLSNFNMLYLRIRGDGRPWMVNVSSGVYFTYHKNDLYNYFMYTTGGPYWQDVKIPFSKFFLSSQGRIQDNQHPLWLDKVSTIGFTLGDKVNGPFQLEIDFIAVYNDRAHTEEFAYEKYKRNPEV